MMSEQSKANIDFAGNIVVKILCGLCTVLLGIAVNSLQSMNGEIKSLSSSVFDLSTQSKVLNVTIDNMEKRITKLEQSKIP